MPIAELLLQFLYWPIFQKCTRLDHVRQLTFGIAKAEFSYKFCHSINNVKTMSKYWTVSELLVNNIIMCLYCGMTKQKLQMHIGFNLLSVTFKNSLWKAVILFSLKM